MDTWQDDHAEQGQWSGDDDRDLQQAEDDEPECCPYCQATSEEAHQPACPLEMHQTFPKPEPRARTKGRKARHERAVKRLVRADCVERDGYCVLKGGAFGACDGPSEWAHVGAQRRARTRGMAPESRHTTAGSAMLCRVHHRQYDAVADDAPIAVAIADAVRRAPEVGATMAAQGTGV